METITHSEQQTKQHHARLSFYTKNETQILLLIATIMAFAIVALVVASAEPLTSTEIGKKAGQSYSKKY